MQNPLEGAAASRRSVLGLLGLSAIAAAGGGSLAACSEKTGGQGTVTGVEQSNPLLPNYIKFEAVKPDLPGTPPVADGYRTYPSSLVQAVSTAPGKGSTINTMTPYWGPVPPGPGSNQYLDKINQLLGAKINPNIKDGNTYIDVLNATLQARDVPDVLVIPSWNVNGIANFSAAAEANFEDLGPYLSRGNVAAYPLLANIPPVAWAHSIWNNKLTAVPWPSGGPFPWVILYRADLINQPLPKTADELHAFGKAITKPDQGVYAFNDIRYMAEMIFRSPGSKEGWAKVGDKIVHKYETPEFKASVEFMAKVFKDGLVHPDLVASAGADAKQLFSSGKVLVMQDGLGSWEGLQKEQQKITPTFKAMAMPAFAHDGGTPLFHSTGGGPVFYTFIKKGLGEAKVKEILGILNWVAAPLGTKEYEQVVFGSEGVHFTRGEGGWPKSTDLAGKEIAEQVRFLAAYVEPNKYNAEIPWFQAENLKWQNETVKYLEKDPWEGLKLEKPKRLVEITRPSEDKIIDIVRGRRPLSDLDGVVKEWRDGGGEEGRAFMAQALASKK